MHLYILHEVDIETPRNNQVVLTTVCLGSGQYQNLVFSELTVA